MNVELYEGERIDDLQTGGLRLIQRKDCFCFGTDSVLLADFASPKRREIAVDLGCGNGAIALLLAGHRDDICLSAVELQPELADMAERSARLNGLQERLRVHCADMRDAWKLLGREKYSLAICNPPYGAAGCTIPSREASCRIARHESDLTPDDVTESAARLLKYGGRFCAVYPAQRAFEMMSAMQNHRLAPKRIRSVHANARKPPKLVLIEAVKGGGSGLNWMAPLFLYNEDGSHSAEWMRIYGHG